MALSVILHVVIASLLVVEVGAVEVVSDVVVVTLIIVEDFNRSKGSYDLKELKMAPDGCETEDTTELFCQPRPGLCTDATVQLGRSRVKYRRDMFVGMQHFQSFRCDNRGSTAHPLRRHRKAS